MAEKKVVVQVLADTKPFIKSLSRLKKLAEGIDSAQIRQSNKVLKNLVQNEKINKRIQKLAIQSAKMQETSMSRAVKHQKGLLDGMMKYAAGLFTVSKLWGMGKKVFGSGLDYGMGAVSAGRTYGASPVEAARVNALYSAFGGKAGEGVKTFEQFMSNLREFQIYGRGPLVSAGARFGVNEDILRKGDFLDFVKALRGVAQSRNFNPMATQSMLEELGMGGDFALMKMVSESEEEFNKSMQVFNQAAISTEETLSGVEDTMTQLQVATNNVKTAFEELVPYVGKIIEWSNKNLTPGQQAGVYAGGGVLGAILGWLGIKSATSLITKGVPYVAKSVVGQAMNPTTGVVGGVSRFAMAHPIAAGLGALLYPSTAGESDELQQLERIKAADRAGVSRTTTNNITVNVEGVQDYSYYRQGQEIAGAITQDLFMNGSSG